MVEALVPVLQEGALLVLTSKDHSTSSTRTNWEEEKAKQLRRLEAICGLWRGLVYPTTAACQ
jgi:hypothetical protein